MRVAIYARYSTDLQSKASIEDQVRLCRERALKDGHEVVQVYSDAAISGASLLRPGIQQLLADAGRGKFELIYTEGLDRISRDQADIASVYKRLAFASVQLVTLADGEITELHVGLKGTMNALLLKDLAAKTRRGLRGRVEAGRSAGGNSFGYQVVRTAADGSDTGQRRIDPLEAEVVRRILTDYAAGRSPRAIALALNSEDVPGPTGRGWTASTINGNAERGTGILNNEMYVGRLVWNRLTYRKDPDSGRRRSRLNPAEQWITKSIPEWRIVDEALWQRVKERQATLQHSRSGKLKPAWDRRRPRYLLSGLAKCGACGSGFVQISATHLGCATARNKGTCSNRRAIARERLERQVLDALRIRLMAPDLFKEFCSEFIREVNRKRSGEAAERAGAEAALARIKRRLRQIVDAIAEGTPARTLKDELLTLEAEEDRLNALIAAAPAEPRPLLNPNMATLYRERVVGLQQALDDASNDGPAAFEAIRSLIDRVVLTPRDGDLTIDLEGHIAAILKLSAGKVAAEEIDRLAEQLMVVAGARNYRYRHKLEVMI